VETKIQHSQFEIKTEAEGRFSGRAMVYNIVDSHNDRTLPGAFTKTISENGGRIRVNAQHEDNPLGWGTLRDSADALLIDVQLEMSMQAARDLFAQIKSALVPGLSIGYLVRNFRYDKNGVRELLDIQLMEVSAVTWQSVPGALINPASIKALGGDAEAVVRYLTSLVEGAKSDMTLRAMSDELARLIAREQMDDVRNGMIGVAERLSALESRLS
jgi:HK97 family phage prohead protease